MKKILFFVLALTGSLSAAPKAVVFDWGNVIGFDNRSVVVDFVCESLHCSVSEFEQANREKRKSGKADVDFWRDWAQAKGMALPLDWNELYSAAVRKSVGADPNMYDMIEALKGEGMRVGLLSNIGDRYVSLIRGFGFYDPFDPCLLSCEMGLEKPDPKSYALLLKTLDLPAGDVVFVDDKVENVEAAKTMGIDAIVFESEEQVRDELVQRGLLNAKGQP